MAVRIPSGPSRRTTALRAAVGLLIAAIAGIWLDTSGTLSSFSTAVVTNQRSAAGTSILTISNTYPSGGTMCAATAQNPVVITQCGSSVYPAKASAAAVSDTITNTGTVPAAALNATYRIASCGPIDLVNAKAGTVTPTGGTSNASGTSGVMLPRFGTTFVPSGGGPLGSSNGIVLDGAAAYASSIGSTTEPVAALFGASYGLGIWFKTTSATTQALFGFGSNVLSTAGTNDRILYLKAGKIGYISANGGTSTALGATNYADGTWHYAYVMYGNGLLGLGGTMAAVFVDGVQVGSTVAVTAPGSYAGYWHVGWSPVSGASAFFSGSLANFTVDDSGSAPTTSTAKPADFTSFDTTRTQQWLMGDSGGTFDGTTTTGTLAAGTALPAGTDPCTYVNVTWPLGQVAASTTLRAVVTRGYSAVANGPAPNASVDSTITLALNAPNAYDAGLILYAPVQSTYTAGSSTSWSVSFVWALPTPGSTFVIA